MSDRSAGASAARSERTATPGYDGEVSDYRPQFGEYATPEEQSRRAGRDVAMPSTEAPVMVAPASNGAIKASAPSAAISPRRPVDRLVTVVLLAYGLVSVIMAAISYLDLTAVMNETMTMMGIDGEFTNYAQGRTWGIIAGLVLIVGWLATAALAVSRLRQAKLSWWVPVAGAVIFATLAGLCLTVPMLGDPAFAEYMSGITAQ